MRSPTLAALFLALPLAAAEKPATFVLFEDDTDALIPLLINGCDTAASESKATAETKDFLAGKAGLRVTPSQRYSSLIKDWNLPVRERPADGEYRYVRFAWKKLGPGPIMVQFCGRDGSWEHRYSAGTGGIPWAAKSLNAVAPAEWTLVTRDLFADFGAFDIGGIAFSPLENGDGLFDHFLLGRTVEDLDKATATTFAKNARPEKPDATKLDSLWTAMASDDADAASAALWTMVAGREASVPFLVKTVRLTPRKAPPAVDADTVKPLLESLNHYRFTVREAAAADLVKLGEGVLSHLRKAADAATKEQRARVETLITRLKSRTASEDARLRRAVLVLKSADTSEARELLAKIESHLSEGTR